MLIGPAAEKWDACFIAEYPSVAAFVEMIRDPVYREAVKHRQAAVLESHGSSAWRELKSALALAARPEFAQKTPDQVSDHDFRQSHARR